MVNDPLDTFASDQAALGYRVKLHYQQGQWECELLAGVAVLPAEQPRPRGFGATWREAADAAASIQKWQIEQLAKRGGKAA